MNNKDVNNLALFLLAPNYTLNIEELKKFDVNSLNEIIFNYNYLKKFDFENILTIINNYFNNDDKTKILRNEEFIANVPSYILENILNNMPFMLAFNMLQNTTILNKVNNININVCQCDVDIIKGYLNFEKLIIKTKSIMIFNMLKEINKEDILIYLNKDYIINRLTNKEIMQLTLNFNIKLNQFINLNTIDNITIRKYYDEYLKKYKNIDEINSQDMIIRLFDINNALVKKIDFNELKYLYEYISSRSNITIQESNHGINSYKAVLCLYLMFGINETKNTILNGNKNINYTDATRIIEQINNFELYKYQLNNVNLFDNPARKIINILDNIKGIDYNSDDDLKNVLIQNGYLKNIIALANIYNYGDFINVFKNYLYYKNDKPERAKSTLYKAINGLVYNVYETQKNILIEKNNKKINKSFRIKESIVFRQKRKIGQNYLMTLKFKVLINTLLNNDNKKFYKKDLDSIHVKKWYKESMREFPINYDSILKYILIPYSMGFTKESNILDNMNVKRPINYQKYLNEIKEKEIVGKINNQIHKMFKNDTTTINNVYNYLSYNKHLNDLDKNVMDIINDFKQQINNLNVKTEIKGNNLVIADSLLLKQDYKLKDYVDFTNMIKKIFNKTYFFINHNIDSNKVLEFYSKEYHSYLDKIIISVNTNRYNYELKERIFCLNDFTKLFKNFDLKSFEYMDNDLKKYLINNKIISFYNEGFYDGNVDLLGLIISKWNDLKSYCNNNNIDINMLNLLELQDVLLNKIFNPTPLEKTIPYDYLVNLINNNLTYNNSNIAKTIADYQKSLGSNLDYLPNISFCLNNLKCESFNKHDNQIFKYGFKNQNSNIFIVSNIKSNETVGYIGGYKKGNVFIFNELVKYNDFNIDKIIKEVSDQIIKSTNKEKDKIDFVIIQNDNYNFGIKIDNNMIGEDDEQDYYVLLADKAINPNNFNIQNNKPSYSIMNRNYKVVGNMATIDDINNINAIIYLYDIKNKLDYSPIKINDYNTIIYSDNWVILISDKISLIKLNDSSDEKINDIINKYKDQKTRILQK